VDTDYFKNEARDAVYDICFVGNMGYRPNIVAAEFLCQEVLPLLNSKRPGVRVLLAGARPHPRVRALENDQVKVSGWMEDIRKAYNESLIFVAPIFTGIGQQNKVLEAMSMELPCVCSSSVNVPIGSRDGKEVMVADDAKGFSSAILKLLSDPVLREKIGRSGRKLVLSSFSWESQVGKLNEIFKGKDERKK